MNRKIFTLILILICVVSSAQQRTVKEIESLFKSISDSEAVTNGQSFQDGSINKTFILTFSTPGVNEIEKKLMKEYGQVVFMCNVASKPFHCYFVKDSEGKRGIIGLDGETIVVPLSGNICNIPNGKDFGILLVGELEKPTPHELLQDWANLVVKRDYGILGLFSSIVVDADKPTIHPLFPSDEYVFLSLGSRGDGKFDVFTMKVSDDNMLWGIVDMKGKEILPNEYTGFIRKGHRLDTGNTGIWGKWIGTTEMDMSEALDYSKDLRAATKMRMEELASTLNYIGETLITSGTLIQSVQNLSSETIDIEGDDSKPTGDLPSQYNKWASVAKRHYNSLTNLGVRVKKGDKDIIGSAGEGMSSSNYVQMKKSLRDAQNQMKIIRQKASKRGIKISKSEYEDIAVIY